MEQKQPAPAPAPTNEQRERDNASTTWPQDKFHRQKKREYGAVIGDPRQAERKPSP